jgi:predicted MFS family arabinose efflux permease
VPSDHTGEKEPSWRGAFLLFGVLFLGVSDTQLIPPLLPLVAEDLGVTPGRAGLVVTVYALAAAAFALLVGTASDRLGRKRLIAGALVAFALASLLTSRTGQFSTLLAARLLTGFSAGALSTLALAYAADIYPYSRRGQAMGILSMAYFLAFVIGIPAGTLVAARMGWRSVFLGLAISTALVFFLIVLLLPFDRPRPARPALSALVGHFHDRDRIAGIVSAFLTSGGLVAFLTYIGVWLAGQGVAIERIGWLLVVAGLGATAASPLSGWLSDLSGKRNVIMGANLILAPGFVLTSRLDWGGSLFLAVGLLGVVASARQAPLHALTTELVGDAERGSYVALRNAASQLGIAVLTTLGAAAFELSGFAGTAWVAAAATLLLIPVCALIREPDRGGS